MDYFRVLAKMLQDEGRGRDTILAHITPAEARLLKSRGGRGSVNPVTGLLEFDDGDGGGDGSGGGEGGGGEGPGGEGGGGGDSSGHGGGDGSNSADGVGPGDSAGHGGGDGSNPADGISGDPTGHGGGDGSNPADGLSGDPNAGFGGYNNDPGGDYYYYPPSAGGGGGGSSAPAAPSFATSPGFLAQLAAARDIGVPQVSIASNYQGSYAPDLGRLMALGLLDAAPVMPAAAQAPMGFGGGGYLDGGMFGQSSLAPISQGQVYGPGVQSAAQPAAFSGGGYQAQPVSYVSSPGGGISYEELLRQQRGY